MFVEKRNRVQKVGHFYKPKFLKIIDEQKEVVCRSFRIQKSLIWFLNLEKGDHPIEKVTKIQKCCAIKYNTDQAEKFDH